MKKIKLSPLAIIVIAVVAVTVLALVVWAVTKSLNKYEGKIVELTSTDGRLQGKVGLKTSGKYLKAYYHILANDTFLMNNNCSNQIEDCQPNSSYDFAIDLVVPSDLGGEGSFLAVYCNKDKYPDNLFPLKKKATKKKGNRKVGRKRK